MAAFNSFLVMPDGRIPFENEGSIGVETRGVEQSSAEYVERWMLFAGANYYPGGGWKDFVGTFESLEALEARYSRSDYDWGQAVRFTGAETAECLWADEWRARMMGP